MDSPPTWLTTEQEAAWRSMMTAILLLPGALDAQLQRDAHLTHAGYGVLAALSEAPARTMRLSRLAAMANVSVSRLSHVVDRLASAGWVAREPAPDDGRSTLAVLTSAGWEKIVASAPSHVENVRTLVFAGLTAAQTRQMKSIFDQINTHLDPQNRYSSCDAPEQPTQPRDRPTTRTQAGRADPAPASSS